jgi:hypothetical protein
MARTAFAGWLARELEHRAGQTPPLLTGALPAPLPTSCRKLRDLLLKLAPVVDIDGDAHLDFLTPERDADDAADSDEDEEEEDVDE